jgi:acyl-CoA thioesterase FadM
MRDRTATHTERFRVAWVDTDAGGRIHFTAAFRWAEAAETSLRRKLGILEAWGSYPRRHVEADFHHVLVFEDEVEVTVEAEAVGTTSITWRWRVDHDGETCIEGKTVVVHVGADGRGAALPASVRAALGA